jgi:hypothetical protein
VLTKDDYLECLHRTKEVSQRAGPSSRRMVGLVVSERIEFGVGWKRGFHLGPGE